MFWLVTSHDSKENFKFLLDISCINNKNTSKPFNINYVSVNGHTKSVYLLVNSFNSSFRKLNTSTLSSR